MDQPPNVDIPATGASPIAPYVMLPALDADGRVADDTACIQCRYNLRTCPSTGYCPECGHAVWHSVRGFYLACAPPAWVRDLGRGLEIVLLAVVAGVVLGIVFVFIGVYLAAQHGWTNPTPFVPGRTLVLAQNGLFLAVLLWAVRGLWRFTRPEPGTGTQPERSSSRRLLRWCCWLLPLHLVGGMVAVAVAGVPTGMWNGAPTTTDWVAFLIQLVFGLIGGLMYLAVPLLIVWRISLLLRRVPRPGWARTARITFWGLLISNTLTVVFYGVLIAASVPVAVAGMRVAGGPTTSVQFPGTTGFNVRYTITTQVTRADDPAGEPASGLVDVPGGVVADDEPRAQDALAELGYVSGPLSSAPTSFPATMPAVPMPPVGLMSMLALGACLGGVGGCLSFGFAICALLVIVVACRTFRRVAEAGERIGAVAALPPTASE